MNDDYNAVHNASEFVGINSSARQKSNTVPTARTRAALDLLSYSSAQELMDNQVNLREVAENLFNWGEQPKATKNIIRALNQALNTPNKYSHAVELTAYIAALSPLLEPDRLVRLFDAINYVDNAYAPARYTLQFSRKLSRILSRYPEERREKLALSLWIESHTGRWWDLTAGQLPNENTEERKVAQNSSAVVAEFLEGKLTFTPDNVKHFSKAEPSEAIRNKLSHYNDSLLKEKAVDPDIAVFVSYLPWLTPLERPESPVGSLLENIFDLIDSIDYEYPEKPKKFSELFPNVKLYGGAYFPFPNAILNSDGTMLTKTASLEVVKNSIELADNKNYMGNCTWSYKKRMEKGEYVLFRIHQGDEIYNASLIATNKGKWNMGEINARFNRGSVPADITDAFRKLINVLPAMQSDNELTKNIENYKKITHHKYKYRI